MNENRGMIFILAQSLLSMVTGQQKDSESGKILYDSIQDVASVELSLPIVWSQERSGRFGRILYIRNQNTGKRRTRDRYFQKVDCHSIIIQIELPYEKISSSHLLTQL
jgi:hypothetical protein